VKVVLFCGGLGMRLRDYSDHVPKPMALIGNRPILWHVMKYYASFGHRDFVLCLGYKADVIKDYFLHYDEAISNDFVLSGRGRVELLGSDIHDWRITFVDTGMHSNLGERLLRVRHLLDGEERFLANYSDGLSDLPLDRYLAEVESRDAIASLVAVRPSQSFHAVHSAEDGTVNSLQDVALSDYWINAGFFCLRREIFDYMQEGEELVIKPFDRLIAERRLFAYNYTGFWAAMDSFKDKITLDRMESRGDCPWKLWQS